MSSRRCAHTRSSGSTRLHDQDARSSCRRFTGRPHARTPLERWSAPGGRGQGKGEDRAREQTLATITSRTIFGIQSCQHDRHPETEAEEFAKIYKLDVIAVPPNKTLRRSRSRSSIAQRREIRGDRHESCETGRGRPVLVGTVRSRIGKTVVEAQRARHQDTCAEREIPPRRKPSSSPRRAARPRHDCDQHGRSRNRHSAGRQSRVHGGQQLLANRRPSVCEGEERFTDDDEFVPSTTSTVL